VIQKTLPDDRGSEGGEILMSAESANSTDLAGALEALRQEVARLGQRVAALEGAATPKAPAPALAEQGVSEEIVLVIAAAVAAFLGKKAHVRQIRLLGSAAWTQQGRVTIQASHAR
jgi:methylmalonyl-CoA carboxyltransferase large subunit